MKSTRTVLAAALAAPLALLSLTAQALDLKPYSADALAAEQKGDRPVALLFHADWCPVCRAQDKALRALKADPAADRALDLTVLVVDYDHEKELRRRLNVRTQSTLIVYKGGAERARTAGETAADKLQAALKAAL